MVNAGNTPAPSELERHYSVAEVAQALNVHPKTVIRKFIDAPGVVRLGRAGGRGHQQRYILRIPHSVIQRVLARMTPGGEVSR
jgi:AraC-like DNA-binding protein